jgi:8-oxo-dGTP pyrophosphatase MutT (NUDIX family)
MPQKYKVYINNKEVIFTKNKINLPKTENQMVICDPDIRQLKKVILVYPKQVKLEKLIIQAADIGKTFRLFSSQYKVVIAAGGLVVNNNGDLLFIFRNGKWDLPKGKTEKGEKTQTTAFREVMEETGLSDLEITKKLSCTYHTYLEKNKKILKKTFWFEMVSKNTNILIPQTIEGITEVKWVKNSEIEDVLNNTYASIADLIMRYQKPGREKFYQKTN